MSARAQRAVRILVLTPGELTRDPRARRQVEAASAAGLDVVGACTLGDGDRPAPLADIPIVRAGGERLSGSLRRAGLGGMKSSSPLVRELRGIWRVARWASRTARLVRAARTLEPFDVVHANDLDTLPAASLLAGRAHARLVYDAHELYTTMETDPPRLYLAAAKWIERRLARRADAVVTTGAPYASELARRLRLRTEPLIVLNSPPRADELPAHASGAPLRVVYQSGSHMPGRPVEDLIAVADHADGVELTVRIVDFDEQAFRAAVTRAGLDGRLLVEAPVSPDRLVEALADYDVGIDIRRPVTENDALSIPNKLFEYMMAGLAVAVPRLPGLAPIVEGEEIGVLYEPGRPDELGDRLGELASDRAWVDRLRARAREAALERYNAEHEAPALLRAWGAG